VGDAVLVDVPDVRILDRELLPEPVAELLDGLLGDLAVFRVLAVRAHKAST